MSRQGGQESGSTPTRLALAFAILAGLCLICLPLFIARVNHDVTPPERGVMTFDARTPWDRPIDLGGNWRLVWRAPAARPGPRAGEVLDLATPGVWEGQRTADGGTLPGSGLATYRLDIQGLRAGSYVLFVPTVSHASQVWINDRLVSRMGEVGATAAATRYLWRAHEIPFEADGGPVRLAIDVAAFHHRSSGLERAPVIGAGPVMRNWLIIEWAKDILFYSIVLILSVFGFVVFIYRKSDWPSLYLAIALLSFFPTALILGHDNMLSIVFPDLAFAPMLALEYITGLSAFLFLNAYVGALFPRESDRRARILFQVGFLLAMAGLAVVFALGDTLTASRLFRYTALFGGLSLIHILYVVTRAAWRGRDSAVLFLFGIGVFLVSILMAMLVETDILARDRVIGIDLFPLGLVVFGFAQIIILAERWSIAMTATEAIGLDLRRLMEVSSAITAEIGLKALLRRIVEATSQFLQADRGTLFLHDRKTGELWSLVAEGVDSHEIRMPADIGVAGHSFTDGDVSIIDDAYADTRFNTAVDERTGYRTRSLLTMPIVARDGRRLGVMQALNRLGRGRFDSTDIDRMRAFAAQAAVAIDNATLFQEVVAERNYNESVLASMAGGVITLGADGRIETLNPAAQRILEVSAEAVIGQSVETLLTDDNAWVLAELDAPRADRTVRALLDVDVRTAAGRTISVNLSIVPLLGDESPGGLLILIEDISQEKRLEGAMRRFMTQRVVDQVLQSQDDLLFGSACVASVLFADIRNFTAMAETLRPRETVDMLNEVFTELVETVTASDGVVDKFIGDAIMAVYGAPLSSGRDPENAVESGVAMMRTLAVLNRSRAARDLPPLRLGIGIATGEVIAGTIGSPKRMDYTVIGDSVNLAARLQDLTKHYGVGLLVCETTAAANAGTQIMRHLDTVAVRGRNRTEKLFEILSHLDGADFPHRDAVLAAYAEGLGNLEARRWSTAAAAFSRALDLHPDDRPSKLMLERATAGDAGRAGL